MLVNIFLFILDFVFILLLVVVGGVFGSIAKKDKCDKNKGHALGVATAFIAVPFVASFVKLDYKTLELFKVIQFSFPPTNPVSQANTASIINSDGITFSRFIEHCMMLIAISGISSYLGTSLLDNIANKVLKSEIKNLGDAQKTIQEEHEALKNDNDNMKREIDRLTARELYQKILAAEKAPNNEEAVSELCAKTLKILEKYDNPELDYELMLTRACVYKRTKNLDKAIALLDKLIAYKKTPIALYNKGCYLFIKDKESKNHLAIKEIFYEGFRIPADGRDKEAQERIIKKVIAKSEPDITGLFSDDELSKLNQTFPS